MLSIHFLDVSGIVAILKHDPAAVIGFALIGASATLCFHLHRKLLAIGQDTSALFFRIPNTAIFTVPRAYLSARSKNDWSAWPAYAVWLTMASGLLLLVLGFVRLAD
jgi:MFS superfamily sulfate permease-like transporter